MNPAVLWRHFLYKAFNIRKRSSIPILSLAESCVLYEFSHITEYLNLNVNLNVNMNMNMNLNIKVNFKVIININVLWTWT
jgi:hypothetical protein